MTCHVMIPYLSSAFMANAVIFDTQSAWPSLSVGSIFLPKSCPFCYMFTNQEWERKQYLILALIFISHKLKQAIFLSPTPINYVYEVTVNDAASCYMCIIMISIQCSILCSLSSAFPCGCRHGDNTQQQGKVAPLLYIRAASRLTIMVLQQHQRQPKPHTTKHNQ